MASLDQVSIAILLGAVLVMAGILSSLLALRFGAPLLLVFLVIGMLAGNSGPGQLQFDDVRIDLSGRLGRAGADPVRRRPAHALPAHPHRAGALDGARHHRRAPDRRHHRAGRAIRARSQLDRVAAGRRRRRLDRRGRGVPAGACAGPAPAAAGRRDAGSRIRQQRSVRGVPHPDAGRVHLGRPQLARPCAAGVASGGRARRRHRHRRRAGDGDRAQSRSRCRRACMRRSSPPRRW